MTSQKPFFVCFCHAGGGLWPTQLVVFCSFCWCFLCSVFPTSKADIPPAVHTTLSPSLSRQLLSHTAVSLVHLSLPTTVLFYLHAPHVTLSSALYSISTSLTSANFSLLLSFLASLSDLSFYTYSFSLCLYPFPLLPSLSNTFTLCWSLFLTLSLPPLLCLPLCHLTHQHPVPFCLLLGGKWVASAWNKALQFLLTHTDT